MIVISYCSPIELMPPAISLVRLLQSMGKKVAFVGLSYTDESRAVLRELKIPYKFHSRWPSVRFREHPFWRVWFAITGHYRQSSLRRSVQRKFLWRALRQLTKGVDDQEVIVWTIGMRVSALFGDGLLAYGKRHIQWLPEYGEETGKDWPGFTIEKLYAHAVLIESEVNRARMLQKDKMLSGLPFVMPNKPFAHPQQRGMPVADRATATIVDGWRGKPVFLYQGSLGNDRKGILDMICWLCEGFPDAVVAVMSPWSPQIEMLSRSYGNFSYVPFVRAPHHLEVTSHATVGLAVYTSDQVAGISPLNGLYCAPNKTFEYGGFGIPLLCNNPPGLRDSVGVAGAAICLDALTRDAVLSGAKRLLQNYDQYAERARNFFHSVDLKKIVCEILRSAGEGGVQK